MHLGEWSTRLKSPKGLRLVLAIRMRIMWKYANKRLMRICALCDAANFFHAHIPHFMCIVDALRLQIVEQLLQLVDFLCFPFSIRDETTYELKMFVTQTRLVNRRPLNCVFMTPVSLYFKCTWC